MRSLTGISCPKCGKGYLEIVRSCGRVRMVCGSCGGQYQIHEVAHLLDEQAEEILSRWTAIIYD